MLWTGFLRVTARIALATLAAAKYEKAIAAAW
jgi:hypothetical protein